MGLPQTCTGGMCLIRILNVGTECRNIEAYTLVTASDAKSVRGLRNLPGVAMLCATHVALTMALVESFIPHTLLLSVLRNSKSKLATICNPQPLRRDLRPNSCIFLLHLTD